MAKQFSQPFAIAHIGLMAWHLVHMLSIDQDQREAILEQIPVGSERGAVQAFQPARFLAPPSEPDVRVSPVSGSPRISVGYVMTLVIVTHGEGIAAPRKR